MVRTAITADQLEQMRQGKISEDERKTLFVGSDLTGADLSGVNLSYYDFTDALLFKTNLSGCELFGANLTNADATGANFDHSNCTEAIFYRTGLGHTSFKQSILFNADMRGATLTSAAISSSDFRKVDLTNARLRDVTLIDSDLTGAAIVNVDLCNGVVDNTEFREANLCDSHLRGVTGYKTAGWIGTDIRQVNFAGAYRIRREIVDQNFLDEFRTQNRFHEFIYRVWWLTSDCGRSMGRWTILVFLEILFFSILYNFIAIDYGLYPTFFSPFYFSVVTMTTLGFGEVVPMSVPAQIIVSIQVLSGYIMLGGLLAILTNKLARRAD